MLRCCQKLWCLFKSKVSRIFEILRCLTQIYFYWQLKHLEFLFKYKIKNKIKYTHNVQLNDLMFFHMNDDGCINNNYCNCPRMHYRGAGPGALTSFIEFVSPSHFTYAYVRLGFIKDFRFRISTYISKKGGIQMLKKYVCANTSPSTYDLFSKRSTISTRCNRIRYVFVVSEKNAQIMKQIANLM